MNIYLMLMAWVVFFTIIGFVVGCLWLCCCNPLTEKSSAGGDYVVLPQGENNGDILPQGDNNGDSDDSDKG